MNPGLARIIQHLQTRHPHGATDLPAVIHQCAEAGFSIVFIIAGLTQVYQIPHGEAKRLVVSHFYRDEQARAKLGAFHNMLESALKDEERIHPPGIVVEKDAAGM